MKKVIYLIAIVCVILSILVGCGDNVEEVKESLCGTWNYDFYASAVGQHCHQIYKFSADGSVEGAWVNDEAPSKSTYKEGTYEIESDKIVITYEDSSKRTIKYSYDDGALKMWDKGSDGSSNNELKKK